MKIKGIEHSFIKRNRKKITAAAALKYAGRRILFIYLLLRRKAVNIAEPIVQRRAVMSPEYGLRTMSGLNAASIAPSSNVIRTSHIIYSSILWSQSRLKRKKKSKNCAAILMSQ